MHLFDAEAGVDPHLEKKNQSTSVNSMHIFR
jgi:hypothetical protein